MPTVSVVPVRAALNLATQAGFDVDALIAGLSFDRTSLRWRRRISWDEYCALSERMETAAGGAAAFEALIERTYHASAPTAWQRLLRGCVGPASLTRFMFEVLD